MTWHQIQVWLQYIVHMWVKMKLSCRPPFLLEFKFFLYCLYSNKKTISIIGSIETIKSTFSLQDKSCLEESIYKYNIPITIYLNCFLCTINKFCLKFYIFIILVCCISYQYSKIIYSFTKCGSEFQ